MDKCLNDLKKFGSQLAKGIKVDSMVKGYGEDVCHLIDELLNIELYRREYQFFMPVFPQEEQEEDLNLDNDDDGHDEYYGT